MELLRRLASVPPDDQATTSITVGEMVFGALRTSRSEDLLRRIETTALANLTILSFDYEAAVVYGRLRCELEKRGLPVSEPDLRIASICVSRGLILVTGNVRHFRNIPGLTIENWLEAADSESQAEE